MSARPSKHNKGAREVDKIRKELDDHKNRALMAADPTDGFLLAQTNSDAAFNALSLTEQSAASLGVSPNAWSPIAFLNDAHYKQLIKANMLDDDLARRIEAYRVVASSNR